jgi:hypothetical protein
MANEETREQRAERMAREARERRSECLVAAELGEDWAESTAALDALDGLRAVMTALVKLHDAALKAGDPRTALECQRQLAHLLGYGRTLTDVTRDGASNRARRERGGQ